jgi:hypothetical protein
MERTGWGETPKLGPDCSTSVVYQKFLDIDVSSTSRLRGVFSENRKQILKSLSNAPKAVIRGAVQAEKATFAQTAIFWGCAG